MVTKYSGYIHTPATRATGYVEDPNGTYVLATNYAALEAERDEWKRRCEKMLEVFNEVACTPACNGECSRCTAERELLAIAEGRDNG